MSVISWNFNNVIFKASYINISEYGKNHLWKFSIISEDRYEENFYGGFTIHKRVFTGFAKDKPQTLTNLRRYKKYLKDIYTFTAVYYHEPTKTVDTLWNICKIPFGGFEIECPEIWKIKVLDYLTEDMMQQIHTLEWEQPF